MRMSIAALAVVIAVPAAQSEGLDSGDAEIGKMTAEVCTACHGANGISVSDDIPNLAGQKSEYLIKQLNNFKSGKRESNFMEPIVATLSEDDIKNVVAFFSELPHGGGHEKSEFGKSINSARLQLPEDYETEFTEYFRNSGDESAAKKIARVFRANDRALAALNAGKPLGDGAFVVLEAYTAKLDANGKPVKDKNGKHVPDELTGMIAQKIVKGGGKEIPEGLRNEDWIYGSFKPNGMHKDANLAKCYACHKGENDSNYLFRLDELQTFANQ